MAASLGRPARKSVPQLRCVVVIAIAALCATVAAASLGVLGTEGCRTLAPRGIAPVRMGGQRQTPAPPANRVYFLKTHKCASTTLQRIIIMYGIKRNLSFALPADCSHQFWPRPFSVEASKRSAAYPHFDIMAVHARHSPSASSHMPDDTVFLSVVRDPAEHLQSLYEYYQVARCLGNASFEQFVRDVGRNRFGIYAVNLRRCPFKLVSNMQMYDFGYDGLALRTASAAQRSIDQLDRTFHLVLVAEQFDESLVLMGDLLNWSADDLVYIKANARASAAAPIADDIRQLIYKWNWADKMLYDYFRSKLQRHASARGRAYVERRVGELASLRAKWRSLCVKSVVSSHAAYGGNAASHPAAAAAAAAGARRADVAQYELSDEGRRNDTCALLTMPELGVIERVHQLWPDVASS